MIQVLVYLVAVAFLGHIALIVAFGFSLLVRRWA
jgi:hypothetical protein